MTKEELTAKDICDSCGSRAYIRTVLENGHDLLFCAHHGNKYKLKLIDLGAAYQDETHVLTEESAK
jgi:hypothetical protein